MSDGNHITAVSATPRWYCVYTKPRRENDAVQQLQRQAYTCFLPRMHGIRQRRGQRVKVVEPLFPRYLFLQARAGIEDLAPVRSTRSVVGLVRFGGALSTVPDQLMNALMSAVEEQGVVVADGSVPQPGDRMRIMEGPLIGLECIFQQASSEQRVLVLMDMISKRQLVSLPAGAIEPVSPRRR